MSNDWSDGPGSNDDFDSSQSPWESPNTTDPGEPDASWQDEPSRGFTPMGPATITDVFNNFQTVMSRSLSSGVAWAFVALLVIQMSVTCIGGAAAAMATVGFASLGELGQAGGNPEIFGGTMIIAFAAVMVLSMIPQLFITGLFNPMQSALFEGQQPHHGFKWALGQASNHLIDIFLVGALYLLSLSPAIGLALITPLAALLWIPVVMIGGFFMMPLLWYVATGHGVMGSFSKSFSTVMENLALFGVFLLVVISASVAMMCVNVVLSMIPILGSLAGMLLGFAVQYAGWAFYVSLVATVDSHEQGREIY
jgi:hypothetical protein